MLIVGKVFYSLVFYLLIEYISTYFKFYKLFCLFSLLKQTESNQMERKKERKFRQKHFNPGKKRATASLIHPLRAKKNTGGNRSGPTKP